MFGFSGCNDCRGGDADKKTDTVKVTFKLPEEAGDKENAAPEPACQGAKLEPSEEERRRLERVAEAERRRREEIARLRREREELRRREEERMRLARQRAEEEEKQRCLLAQEQAREEELQRQEEARKQEALEQFLSAHGFDGVGAKKKKKGGMLSSGFTYPLHAAAKAADAHAVELLLWAGADKTLKDSAKLTPLGLAQKANKKGSHVQVIDLLSA